MTDGDTNPPKKARIEPKEIYSVINSFIIQHFSDYKPKFVLSQLQIRRKKIQALYRSYYDVQQQKTCW